MTGNVILRKWTANIRTTDVAEYSNYVKITGADGYQHTSGYLGHEIIIRDLGGGVSEFSALSWWSSMDAVRTFAGPNPEVARYYAEDDRFLLTRPEIVEHYRVLTSVRLPD